MRAIIGAALAGVVALSISACDASAISSDAKTHSVTYKVTGSVPKGDITFTDGGTSTTQRNGIKLPWKKSFKAKGSDVLVYQVMVQNSTMNKGKVSCKIVVDGKVVKKNTSTGAGAIASCDYTPKHGL